VVPTLLVCPLASQLLQNSNAPSRPRTNDVTLSLLARAKFNGFKALVVTLDTLVLGWRPHDFQTAYRSFTRGVGIEVGQSDPAFMARHNRQPILDHHPEFPYDAHPEDRAHPDFFRNWEDLKWLRQQWDGHLVLKGIQTVQVRLLMKAS